MVSTGSEKSGSQIDAGQLPSLESLRKFVVVAEELSFTRASRRLHVVQSGVSSAIQGLERELGAVLFDRDRHRVALTDAGQALLPEARATLAARRPPRMRWRGRRGAARHPHRRHLSSTGPVDLPGCSAGSRRRTPEVALHLRQAASRSDGLARQVIAGPARPGPAWRCPASRRPGSAAAGQRGAAWCFICAPGDPLARGGGPRAARLAGEPFGLPTRAGGTGLTDRAFAAAGLRPQNVPFGVAGFGSRRPSSATT